MSQLARRENAPHRAAFVTSLSRWYICRLLGNLPPFHPCLSAESEAPFCPLRNIVTLRAYSLEIKVRQAISVFLSVYPELVALVGSRVPDYRGIFLRGHGSQVSTHYGNVTHASAGLGVLQGDAIREIWGSYPELISPGESSAYGAMAYGASWSDGGHATNKTDGWRKRSADFYASRVTPVAGEIRQANRSVKFLIRAK